MAHFKITTDLLEYFQLPEDLYYLAFKYPNFLRDYFQEQLGNRVGVDEDGDITDMSSWNRGTVYASFEDFYVDYIKNDEERFKNWGKQGD